MDPQRLPDELVVAGRYTHLIDAEVARSVLVGARIPCTLRNQAMVGVVPHLSNAIGGVTLHVEARYAEEARRLLEAAEPAKIQADPRRPEEAELEGDEHDRGLPSARDTQATRAFRCA